MPDDSDERAGEVETSSGLNAAYTKWKWVGNQIFQLSLFRVRRKEGGWRRALVILEL